VTGGDGSGSGQQQERATGVGTVIKKGAAAKLFNRFEPIALRDHVAEARAALAAARKEADQIVEAAREQARAIEAAAREEGYARGRREGVSEGLQAGRQEAFERVKRNSRPSRSSCSRASGHWWRASRSTSWRCTIGQ